MRERVSERASQREKNGSRASATFGFLILEPTVEPVWALLRFAVKKACSLLTEPYVLVWLGD